MKLLDTNVCIAYLNGRDARLRDRLLAERNVLALCSMVKAELLYGARKSARVDENLARLDRFFAQFSSLPFDDASASQYGILRALLHRAGTPIGAGDLVIAAITLSEDATLVTRNTREFARIPGLRVEEW